MTTKNIIPIILCGGSGTRLWPLSRKSFPKQFLSLESSSKKTLLQLTLERTKKLEGIKEPILICNEEHRFIVAEQMRNINIQPKSIILEPFGKNTAPSITLAAIKALEKEKDPLLLILSSDHIIGMEDLFIKAISAGIEYAQKGKLITFGIVPTSPETGYGYIKSKETLNENSLKGEIIESFIEKPNLETAKEYLLDRRFTWNSGIFLFKANIILEEMKKFSPEILKYCETALNEKLFDLDFQRLNENIFSHCPNISIDFAILENTKKGMVIPLNANWTDIGSWDSVWKISKKNEDGNFIEGNIVTKNTKNCYLRSEKRLITTIGLENLVVVETSDAILVADMRQAQEIKEIVNILKKKNISAGKEHKKIYRPWGYYESIFDDDRWQIKLITVKPGQRLSLQKHNHRAEHWIVVSGTAKVEIEENIITLYENQSSYIPMGSKHRLCNPGKIPLLLIEVQCGSYLGEDDIERFEDNYGRITSE